MEVGAKVLTLCLIWQITVPAHGVKWPIKNISTLSKFPLTSLPTPQIGNTDPEREENDINNVCKDAVPATSYNIKQISKPSDENKFGNKDRIYNDGKANRDRNSINPFIFKQYTKDSPSNDKISYLTSNLQALSSPNVFQNENFNNIKEAQSVNRQDLVNNDIRENLGLCRDLEDRINVNTKQENSLDALYSVNFDTNSDSDITDLIRCKNSINNFLPQVNCESTAPITSYNSQNNYNNLYSVKSLPYSQVNNQNFEVNNLPFNDNLNRPISKEEVIKYFQKEREINEINNKICLDFAAPNMGRTDLYVFENNVNEVLRPLLCNFNSVNNPGTNLKSINDAPGYQNPTEQYLFNGNHYPNTVGSQLASFNNIFSDVKMLNTGSFTNTIKTPIMEAEKAKLCDSRVINPGFTSKNFVPSNTIRNPNSDLSFNYKPGFIEIQTDFKNGIKDSTPDLSKLGSKYPIPNSINSNSAMPLQNPFNIPNVLPNPYPSFGQSVSQLPNTELPSRFIAEYNSISSLQPTITSPKSGTGQQNTIPIIEFTQTSVKPEVFNPVNPALYGSRFDISNSFTNKENDISCKNPTKVDYNNFNSLNNVNSLTIPNTNYNNFASPSSNNLPSQVASQFTGIDDNSYKITNNFIPSVNLPQNFKQDYSQLLINNDFSIYPIPSMENIQPFSGLPDNPYKLSNNFIPNVNIPQIIPQNLIQENLYTQFSPNNDFRCNSMPQVETLLFQNQPKSANKLETPVNFINYESPSYQIPNLPAVNLNSQTNTQNLYQNSKCDDTKLPTLQYTSSARSADYNSNKYLTTSPLPVQNLAPISNLPSVSPSCNPVNTQAVQPTYTYANVVTKNPLASQVEKILSPTGIVGSIKEAANTVAKNVLTSVIAKKLAETKKKVPPPNFTPNIPTNLPPVNPYSKKSCQMCSCLSNQMNEPPYLCPCSSYKFNEPSYPCPCSNFNVNEQSYPCPCSNYNFNEPPCFRDFYYQSPQPLQTKSRPNAQLYNGFEVPDIISRLNFDTSVTDLPYIFNEIPSDKPDWTSIMEPAITQPIPYLNSVTVNIVPVTEDFGYEVRNVPNLLNFDFPNVPSIPNYLNFELPNVPYLPNTPNVLNFDFPSIPCPPNTPNVINYELPNIPCLPSVPSTPNMPNVLNYELPNVPCLPNTPNVLNFELPSISFLPTPNINIPNLFDSPMNSFNSFNYDIPFVIPSYLPTPNINMGLPPMPQIIDVPAIKASIKNKDTNELNRILELVVLSELMNNNEFIDPDAIETAVTLMLLSS